MEIVYMNNADLDNQIHTIAVDLNGEFKLGNEVDSLEMFEKAIKAGYELAQMKDLTPHEMATGEKEPNAQVNQLFQNILRPFVEPFQTRNGFTKPIPQLKINCPKCSMRMIEDKPDTYVCPTCGHREPE
jgi:rubrerythrin